jgi:hypothetical protein
VYIYIDESDSNQAFVQTALVLYDRNSKNNVSRIVTETIIEFGKFLKNVAPSKYDRLLDGRIPELKGAESRNKKTFIPGLNEYPAIRDRFYNRLMQEANFTIHICYMDRKQNEYFNNKMNKRYGQLLQVLFKSINLPSRNIRHVTVIIDSMAKTKSIQENSITYTWRKREKRERMARIKEKEQHQSWSQRINTLLKYRYPGKKLHRKLWMVRSHQDKCLQAVDIFSNFFCRYRSLGIETSPFLEKDPSRKNQRWFSVFNQIRSRVWWIHNPRIQKAKNLASYQKLKISRDLVKHNITPAEVIRSRMEELQARIKSTHELRFQIKKSIL